MTLSTLTTKHSPPLPRPESTPPASDLFHVVTCMIPAKDGQPCMMSWILPAADMPSRDCMRNRVQNHLRCGHAGLSSRDMSLIADALVREAGL